MTIKLILREGKIDERAEEKNRAGLMQQSSDKRLLTILIRSS